MDSFKIDIHNHTIASDGTLNFLDLLTKAEERGMSALVLTDHMDSNRKTFRHNKGAVRVLRDILKDRIPIIIGSEIYSPWGHLLLFGDKATKQYLNMILTFEHLKKVDPFKWCEEFIRITSKQIINGGKIEHLVVLPHADFIRYNYAIMPKNMRAYIDAFEYTDSGVDMRVEDKVKLQGLFTRAKGIVTTDCHSDEVGLRYIETEKKVNDVTGLIAAIRRGKFKLDY